MLKILAILLVFSSGAHAAGDPQFLEMTENDLALVSHPVPPTAKWIPGDFLCIYHANRGVACGVVASATPAGALIKLDFANDEPLKMGDRVSKPRTGKEVAPATISENANIWFKAYTPRKNWFRTAVLWDLDQAFWTVGYDRALSSHVSVGLKFDKFDAFNTNSVLDGYGVLFTRTFFTAPYFGGVAAQIGIGPYFFTSHGSGPTNGTTLIADINVAWRWQIRSWFGLGFQFGLRWIPRPNVTGFDMGPLYHPLRSAIGLDVSLRF